MEKNILVCLLLLMIVVSCEKTAQNPQPHVLTQQEIREKLVSANSNVASQSLKMKINIYLVVASPDQKTKKTTTLEAESETSASGAIDKTSKKAFFDVVGSVKLQGSRTETENLVYIVDGYLYTKLFGQWVRTRLTKDLWKQQDQVSQLTDLLQNSTTELLPDETSGGQQFYVMNVKPDPKTVVDLSLKQQGSKATDGMNFSDILKSYDATYWVNKDTFMVERAKISLRMVLNANNSNMTNGGTIEMLTNAEYNISDINKPVNITLPAEAAQAEDISKDTGAADLVTGNAILGSSGIHG